MTKTNFDAADEISSIPSSSFDGTMIVNKRPEKLKQICGDDGDVQALPKMSYFQKYPSNNDGHFKAF